VELPSPHPLEVKSNDTVLTAVANALIAKDKRISHEWRYEPNLATDGVACGYQELISAIYLCKTVWVTRTFVTLETLVTNVPHERDLTHL
jgi:hypothetical protein